MLAFANDITRTNPKHPQEENNAELKEYMDYQRKLKHQRILNHSLEYAKTSLQEKIQAAMGQNEKLADFLQQTFPLSHKFADADTVMLLLRKLSNGHNSSNNWYRLNAYYHALVFDCMKRFIDFYNQLVEESPEKAKEYDISEGMEIDFGDWAQLFFPDLDFHVGRKIEFAHYPFAKRNQAIEEELEKEMGNGKSREEALQAIKDHFEIEDSTIQVLLNEKIGEENLELFYTSKENPIYEYLTQKQEGSWDAIDGETLEDQAYALGSHLKVWKWKKRKK